jgi:hypothetical protein
MWGFALKGTTILPKLLSVTAIVLGVLFQSLGAIALFDNEFLLMVIGILMLQNFMDHSCINGSFDRKEIQIKFINW